MKSLTIEELKWQKRPGKVSNLVSTSNFEIENHGDMGIVGVGNIIVWFRLSYRSRNRFSTTVKHEMRMGLRYLQRSKSCHNA
jgi:hypothetical protein